MKTARLGGPFWSQHLYCARFSSTVDADGVEAWLVGVGAEATLAVSVLALGAEAVDVGAGSVFRGAGASALIVAEVSVEAFGLAAGVLGVGAGAEATVDLLELTFAEVLDEVVSTFAVATGALGALALLRVGVGAGAGATSATFDGASFVSVVVAATSAGAAGSAPGAGVAAACVAGSGTTISLSFRAWLK